MDSSTTSLSLIHRIQHADDQQAWREFVERYGPNIYRWCLARRLQPSDADDVTQNVLVRLARSMRKFDYDPSQSFRGWLRRMTENSIKNYVRDQKAGNAQGGSDVISLLASEPARTDLTAHLAEAFDLEIVELAKSNVRNRVNESRWQSWQLTAVDGLPGKEVADRLNVPIGTVYASKNQVQKMIREEVERLEAEVG